MVLHIVRQLLEAGNHVRLYYQTLVTRLLVAQHPMYILQNYYSQFTDEEMEDQKG